MLHHIRRGSGRPLLLVHGIGGSHASWDPIVPALAKTREVIAIDLPGHGGSSADADSSQFAGQVAAVETFIAQHGLGKVDLVGSSMGGRIVLELARRGAVGAAVALDPGGFWSPAEATYLRLTLTASVRLLRAARPLLGFIGRTMPTRTAILAQLSARPWALEGEVVARELKGFASCDVFLPLLDDLARGPVQAGPAADADLPLVIGWGRQDRLCFPGQARRAAAAFPSAELCWFDRCGHFPMWDQPRETTDLILAATAERDGGGAGDRGDLAPGASAPLARQRPVEESQESH